MGLDEVEDLIGEGAGGVVLHAGGRTAPGSRWGGSGDQGGLAHPYTGALTCWGDWLPCPKGLSFLHLDNGYSRTQPHRTTWKSQPFTLGSGPHPGTWLRIEGALTGAVAPDPPARVSRWTRGTSAHGSGLQTQRPPESCQRRRQLSRGCWGVRGEMAVRLVEGAALDKRAQEPLSP